MSFILRGNLLLFFVLIIMNCFGQSPTIGKQWPDLEFANVLNYTGGKMRLSDFRGKVIIIHFWARSCQPCIAAFPKLEKLQKEFADKIQIILVNSEDKAGSENFFIERKRIAKPTLPMATGETELHDRFRLMGDVWLDTSRTIRYVSNSYHITSRNISEFLEGNDLAITQRQLLVDFNPEVPLIAEGNGRWMDSIKQYSYFFRNGFEIIESLNSGPWMPGAMPNRIFQTYTTPMTLFNIAFNEREKYEYKVVLELKDSSRFVKPGDDDLKNEWNVANRYTYDLLVPKERASEIYKFMQADLERFFEVDVRIEKRPMKCTVLLSLDGCERLKSKGGESRRTAAKTDSTYNFYNWPFEKFANYLNGILPYFSAYPFKDESGLSCNIDIFLSKEVIATRNLQAIRQELNKYGLTLEEKICEKDVLVISDQKK